MSKEIIDWIKKYIPYCIENHTWHKTAQQVRDCVFSALREIVYEQSNESWVGLSGLPWEIKISYACSVEYHKQCAGCDCSCHKETSE